MQHEGKNVNPFKHLWLSALILTIVPIGFFLLVFCVVHRYSREPIEGVIYTSMCFGGAAGTLFHMSCIIGGLFKNELKVVVKRLGNLFSNLTYSRKMAFMIYKEDVKENGISFWVHSFVILAFLGFTIYGVINVIDYYNILDLIK